MRILFLSPTLPFPPIGGERLRAFYFLKYLSRKHKITLLSFIENKDELKALKSYKFDIDIHTVRLPKWQSYFKTFLGLFSCLPLELHYYSSLRMQNLVYRKLEEHRFDLIFCHLIRMGHFIQDKEISIKKVLDISDALPLRYRLSSNFRKNIFKFVEGIEAGRLQAYEPKMINNFDLALIASSKDREYYENNLKVKNLLLIPNGVEVREGEIKQIKTKLKKIVFFANFRPFPNRDAFFYFYRRIYLLVKEKIKNINFVIVGANIPRQIFSLKKYDSSIDIHCNVSDIAPFIEDACISVVPMRIAVGIQNKILQSMAFKVPVVTTTIGLGDIEAKPDRDIMIADSPEEFSEKIITLIQNAGLRKQITDNAYRLIKEKYCWPQILEELNQQCLKVIS